MSEAAVQLKSCKSVPGTSSSELKYSTRQREKAKESPSKGSNKGKKKLCSFAPRDVAEEMTLFDASLLRLIKASELEDGAWMKKDKEQKAPNIMTMVKSFNKVALLVPTEILEETTPHARAKVISVYIKIAQECYCHGNYNSLKAVLAGLQCTPIFRLTKTWKEVPSRKRKKFEELSKVMHEDNNWAVYRKEISKKLYKNQHFVPFLGIFLTTTAFAQTQQAYQRQKSGTPTKEQLDIVRASHRKLSTESMYETYHILEAITVREKLDKLRRTSVTMSPGQISVSSAGSERAANSICSQMLSPLPVVNGLLTETPPTTPDADIARWSCCEPSSPLLDCSGYVPPSSSCKIIEPVDDASLTSPREQKMHSASEGNVMIHRILPKSSPDGGSRANTLPARPMRTDFERSFEDEVDLCMEEGGSWNLGIPPNMGQCSPQQKGKRMRVTQGISRTAKFFAMLRSRYRNGMSSTVGTGLGDVVMDNNAKLDGARVFLDGQHHKKHKPVGNRKNKNQLQHRDVENIARSDGRRPSGCGLFRSNSQHEALSSCARRSLSPGGGQGADLNHMLSGSLEGLLTAVNNSGLSEELTLDISGYGDEEEQITNGVHPPHSQYIVTSPETSDQADGNGVSLTLSFSSPSLKSLMDEAIHSRQLRPASVCGPSNNGKDPERMSERIRSEKEGDCSLEREKNRHSSAGDSLSRTPSMSSMDSAGSSQSHGRLRHSRGHQRNSSDPNFFLITTPPKKGRELSVSRQVTSPSGSSLGKSSSPLVHSLTRDSPGPRQPSFERRSGFYKTSVTHGLLLEEGEESLSPQDLLHQYQFLSLGCCYLINSRPHIREVLTSGNHNSEALNYKLSYSVEPG